MSAAQAAKRKAKRKAVAKANAAAAEAEDHDEQPKMSEAEVNEMKAAKEWLAGIKEDDIISAQFFSADALAARAKEWKAATPFPRCTVQGLVDGDVLKAVRDELMDEEFYLKSNDLYEFTQSNDLKNCTKPVVKKLRDVLYGEKFRGALKAITGIDLVGMTEHVSMSANIYRDTNRLLCHDDELQGRRIAYILYLVPEDWSAADGGALDYFSVDAAGQPSTVHASVLPKWNAFSFFEVSAVSYHQVAEVLSKHKSRLSISGWFHGKPIKRPAAPVQLPLSVAPLRVLPAPAGQKPAEAGKKLSKEELDAYLERYVGREYRKPNIQRKVATAFARDSSIELYNFLRKDVYEQLMAEIAAPAAAAAAAAKGASSAAAAGGVLGDEGKYWSRVGPANKQRYMTIPSLTVEGAAGAGAGAAGAEAKDAKANGAAAKPAAAAAGSSSSAAAAADGGADTIGSTSAPVPQPTNPNAAAAPANSVLRGVTEFLTSTAFGQFLSTCTGLPVPTGVHAHVRKFAAGDYTLGHDEDPENKMTGLDVTLCLLPSAVKWKAAVHGGSLHYVEEGVTEELLSIDPAPNTLSIVYRADGGVYRFVKYVNHKAPAPRADVSLVYRLPEEDGAESDSNPLDHDDGSDAEGDGDGEDADDADDGDEPAAKKAKGTPKRPAAAAAKAKPPAAGKAAAAAARKRAAAKKK